MNEDTVVQALQAHVSGKRLSSSVVKSLRDHGYVETSEVTHLQSPESEYIITFLTEKARALLERHS